MTRTRRLSCPGSAAHRRRDAALRPGHESGVWRTFSQSVIASVAKQSRVFPRRDSGLLRCARNDGARGAVALAQHASQFADTPTHPRDLLRPSFASSRHPPMSEGAGKTGCRPGTHGPLCACSAKGLHSGIQVKPNTRPSLRSGLTAYAEFSPGSDALLPPSPCRSLMRVPGRAATSPQDLAHRPRAPGRHGFAVR